jgi:hypothetical protein
MPNGWDRAERIAQQLGKIAGKTIAILLPLISIILLMYLTQKFHLLPTTNFKSLMVLITLFYALGICHATIKQILHERKRAEQLIVAVPQKPNKLAVNAAIEKLILTEGKDQDAAKILVQYAHHLPQRAPRSLGFYKKKGGDQESFTGMTQEFGNVTTKTGNEKVSEKDFGVIYDRVGQYKLYKYSMPNVQIDRKIKNASHLVKAVLFKHFWMADITTQNSCDEDPEEYALLYHHATLCPLAFGKVGKEVLSKNQIFGGTVEYAVKHIVLQFPEEGKGNRIGLTYERKFFKIS